MKQPSKVKAATERNRALQDGARPWRTARALYEINKLTQHNKGLTMTYENANTIGKATEEVNVNNQNNSEKKDFFQQYINAELTIVSARDTLTAVLCAMNDIEDSIINAEIENETISALYGVCSIIRNCRDDLSIFLSEKETDSMSANCE